MGTNHAATLSPVLDISGFRAAVNDSFVPLRVSTAHAEQFRGVVSAVDIDDIHLTHIRATDHCVERTPDLIAADPAAFYKIGFMIEGTGLLVQDGRDALLGPGDLAIYDTSRPYSLTFGTSFRTMVIMLPRASFPVPPEALASLTAVPLRGDSGLPAMIGPFLRELATGFTELPDTTCRRLARNAVDLLATTFGHELGTHARAEQDPHLDQLRQIDEFIDTHLADRDLGPSMIAAAHFISLRHLHGLFHRRNTTVSKHIKARRLQRCHRDLLDATHAQDSVVSIAARWGFADATHFSRAFKAAFGVPPGRLRAGG
ncbi:helix-turn-helix domain-containing protein [Microbacterium sp.]|uniref:AraC-like ligand-binding domain-containing protein n=1 Tax=Microbacterium sp. TaxID=51671 RepID=UPI003A8A06B5